MKITTSYAVEILHPGKQFQRTVEIYRAAVTYLIDVVAKELESVFAIAGAKKQMRIVECLVHRTSKNEPTYDFDSKFYKMPVYLRRAATNAAIGAVSSYRSNYENWLKSDRKNKPPALPRKCRKMPVFYNANMYKKTEDDSTVLLKLFDGSDWKWVPFSVKKTDAKYIQKHCKNKEISAPTLERRYGKYFLRFSFTEKVDLYNTPIEKQTICAVDLGLNTGAVCSIMQSDGTILARKFINFPSDKDHLYHVLNRIKKAQREHGSHNIGGQWRYARAINKELSVKIASAIVDFAVLYNCDIIVFEHLDTKGKKISGSKKQKIAMWRKNFIQDIATIKAHQNGMRISRICAWNTSRLAYDGSGVVCRDPDNHALATFQNGKHYNCDLSASYNIGARYFIRELLKPLPVKERSQVGAKVPDCERRTSCTYNTLLLLVETLAAVVV